MSAMDQDSRLFASDGRVQRRVALVSHRDDEYDEGALEILLRMQREHFWYRGRHRFVLAAVRRHLRAEARDSGTLHAIDLGAGCGGWVDHLDRSDLRFAELALADSSPRALTLAARCVSPQVPLFQVDLLDLGWRDRWDVVFLLDVLEHLPDPEAVLRQIRDCLAPGGLLFVTVPALDFFWSYNDELARHQRRYALADLAPLAEGAGLALVDARYFMFLLSPLVALRRLRGRPTASLDADRRRALLARTHRVPAGIVNASLAGIFALETPLGLTARFPWGTSLLAVMRK